VKIDKVTLRTLRGTMATEGPFWEERLVRPIDIRPGNAAMYYPEANVLVPRHIDAASRTPAFKDVLVEVTPSAP